MLTHETTKEVQIAISAATSVPEDRHDLVRMSMTAQASPSREARSLFNNMVAYAQPLGENRNTLHIDVGSVLVVGCQRARQGLDAAASEEIGELLGEKWITPAPSGGWFLG